jgi:AGZA family xanthine/uracil permease-like MFS transporter
MRWFVRGDVDGFFGLAIDNLVQLLLIDALCRGILGFPADLVYGRILPGAAVSLVVGNLFYAWQAMKVGRAAGRSDVCALPYGINTVSLFAYVFLVMLPAKLAAEAAGAADPARIAWQAGLAACVGSGLIELSGALFAERLRKATPRAALLGTLAGIALTFISIGFLFRAYARPLVGLSTLAIVVLVYFGRRRFRGGLPGGLVAVLLGTLLAWMQGIAPVGAKPALGFAFHPPIPVFGDLVAALSANWLVYLSVILPMGLFNLIGSLQNIESAEAAGDSFPTRPSLAANGIGTLAAALFGSCFPTTIYIGHPGWKAMGARAGYSVLNAAFFTAVCLSGTLAWIAWAVPIDAGMAIVLWIGIVITAQAFQATPAKHAPAVVVGLLPGVAAWGALLLKNGLRAAGMGAPGGESFGPQLVDRLLGADVWANGVFALEQGFILTSMILAAATAEVIDQRFGRAALWAFAGAVLSAVGLIHSWRFTPADTAVALAPAWPHAAGYLAMGVVFLAARWATTPTAESGAH